MSKFIGKYVRVIKENAITFHRVGTISRFDKTSKKFVVEFNGGWVGWYGLSELELI